MSDKFSEYHVDISSCNNPDFCKIFMWLRDNISYDDFATDYSPDHEYYDRIYFRHKEDYIMAKLRFGL